MLIPKYMHDFTCIGTQCEDTCCAGWKVAIDHKTYKKYKKLPNQPIKEKINQSISRNRSNPSEGEYATIKMNEEGFCPMLDGDKLCTIHSTLGEDYLSLVCKLYPRYINKVDTRLEMSATPSCPEAARLALLNPDVMEFDVIESPYPTMFKQEIITENNEEKLENYFWELRFFTIGLLQMRKFSIQERLILLGLFYKKIQQAVDENGLSKIPQIIRETTDNLKDDGYYKETFAAIPSILDVQIKLVSTLIDVKVEQGIRSKRFAECLEEFVKGLSDNNETEQTSAERRARYKQSYEQYYRPYMEQHEYILENYLVNYVFSKLFSFDKENKVFDSFVSLTLHYAMIKLLLIGIAGYHKKLTAEIVIKVIQSFAKEIEHSSFISFMHDILKENDYTSMGYMAVLIKN